MGNDRLRRLERLVTLTDGRGVKAGGVIVRGAGVDGGAGVEGGTSGVEMVLVARFSRSASISNIVLAADWPILNDGEADVRTTSKPNHCLYSSVVVNVKRSPRRCIMSTCVLEAGMMYTNPVPTLPATIWPYTLPLLGSITKDPQSPCAEEKLVNYKSMETRSDTYGPV